MSNFIGLVFATLKNEGVDTSGMSTDEAIKKYNELQQKSGGKAGEKEGTPAEQKRMKEMGFDKKEDSEKKSVKIINKLDNQTFRNSYHFLDWVGYETNNDFKWSNNKDGSMTIKAFGNEYNVKFNLNENRENSENKYQVKITKIN